MDFILFNRRKKLVISISTCSITNGISGSIVHIVLRVNNLVEKNYHNIINI